MESLWIQHPDTAAIIEEIPQHGWVDTALGVVSFSFVIEWRFVFSVFSTTCYVQHKTSDFRALEAQFYQERDSFWYMASNVLNKPKPKNR